MLNELEAVLVTKVSPERADILRKAAQIIEAMGLHNVFLEIEQLLSMEDEIDPSQLLYDVEYILLQGMRVTLNNFSIYSSSTNIELLIAIVEGVRDLEHYEDYDTVLAILETDQDDEETLAELLELTTEYPAEDFLNVLDSVSHRLTERIYSLFQEEDDNATEYGMENSVENIVKRLKAVSGLEDSIVYDNIAEGLPLGLDPAHVVNRIVEDIAELSSKEVAKELALAILASNVENEKVAQCAKGHVEELFDNANFISDANMAIDVIVREALSA